MNLFDTYRPLARALSDGPPKELRDGFAALISGHCAMVALLIEKGVFSETDFERKTADFRQRFEKAATEHKTGAAKAS